MNNKSLEQLFDMIFSKNIFEQKILVLHYILTGSETRSEFNYYIINYKNISWRCTLFQIIMGDGVCLVIDKLKKMFEHQLTFHFSCDQTNVKSVTFKQTSFHTVP